MGQLVNVVYRGDVAEGFQLASVQSRLFKLFDLTNSGQQQRLLGSKPTFLKRAISAASAAILAKRLLKLGVVVELEPIEGGQTQFIATKQRSKDSSSVKEATVDTRQRAPLASSRSLDSSNIRGLDVAHEDPTSVVETLSALEDISIIEGGSTVADISEDVLQSSLESHSNHPTVEESLDEGTLDFDFDLSLESPAKEILECSKVEDDKVAVTSAPSIELNLSLEAEVGEIKKIDNSAPAVTLDINKLETWTLEPLDTGKDS